MQNFNVILMVIFVLLYMLLLLHNLHFIHKKPAMKIKIDSYLACIHPYACIGLHSIVSDIQPINCPYRLLFNRPIESMLVNAGQYQSIV